MLMFEAMADRVRAGEPWHEVLKDYGLRWKKKPKARKRPAITCTGCGKEFSTTPSGKPWGHKHLKGQPYP